MSACVVVVVAMAPAALQEHAGSTSRTLSAAQQLGSPVHTQAVNAFTTAMGTGYLVIAVIVLIAAGAIAPGLRHLKTTT